MPQQPILELYVVWHPLDKKVGEATAAALVEHFHGPAYSGLAGGAVEVYIRSQGWDAAGGPPRPLPTMQPLPARLPNPQLTAVVPVIGYYLAEAVEQDPAWRTFMEGLLGGPAASRPAPELIGVYGLAEPGVRVAEYELQKLIGRTQWLPMDAARSPSLLAREVAQIMTQDLRRLALARRDEELKRIKVFVSHTKQSGASEGRAREDLVDSVRRVIRSSHLDEFFDAHDIQVHSDWAEEIDREAGRSALLMIRTDLYSSREWTQREVATAKTHDMPIVALFAASAGDNRGSFLMDHVPIFPCNPRMPEAAIERALNRLVDETLKRAIWDRQTVYLQEHGFDWMPGHAPELVTLMPWLARHQVSSPKDGHVWILHPDPPLGPSEFAMVESLCRLAGFDGLVDVLTPRTFAGRGGRLPQ